MPAQTAFRTSVRVGVGRSAPAFADRGSGDQASRLREQVAGHPPRAQRAIPRIDTVPTYGSDSSSASPFARAVVDWFANQVAEQVTGELLHGSQRRSLLKTAERLGIDRFHANLIIAVAQHEAGKRQARRDRTILRPRRRFGLATAAMIGIVQSLILWGAWHVVHGV